MRSNDAMLSYAAPSVEYVTPSQPSLPSDDIFEIHGSNFGYHGWAATVEFEDATVRIGDVACTGIVIAGDDPADAELVWRSDGDGSEPYLMCRISEVDLGDGTLASALTVGSKNLTVTFAGRTVSYPASDNLIFGTCDEGYYALFSPGNGHKCCSVYGKSSDGQPCCNPHVRLYSLFLSICCSFTVDFLLFI